MGVDGKQNSMFQTGNRIGSQSLRSGPLTPLTDQMPLTAYRNEASALRAGDC